VEPACLDDCAKQFPQGAVEYDAVTQCADAACAIACE
jgi:hypothetical protein